MLAELAQSHLNIRGLVALIHHFARKMAERREGGIINIASNASFQPVSYMATYGETKALVLMIFSEALAEELRDKSVKVMTASPGSTATQLFEHMSTKLLFAQMDLADLVAKRTLDDFGRGKTVSYPCLTSVRIATWVARLLPRSVVAKLTADISRKIGFAE
jgi:hypothetical protein